MWSANDGHRSATTSQSRVHRSFSGSAALSVGWLNTFVVHDVCNQDTPMTKMPDPDASSDAAVAADSSTQTCGADAAEGPQEDVAGIEAEMEPDRESDEESSAESAELLATCPQALGVVCFVALLFMTWRGTRPLL